MYRQSELLQMFFIIGQVESVTHTYKSLIGMMGIKVYAVHSKQVTVLYMDYSGHRKCLT